MRLGSLGAIDGEPGVDGSMPSDGRCPAWGQGEGDGDRGRSASAPAPPPEGRMHGLGRRPSRPDGEDGRRPPARGPGGDAVRSAFPGTVATWTLGADELAALEERCQGRRQPAPLPRSTGRKAYAQACVDWLSPFFPEGQGMDFTGTYSDEYGYSHGLMLPRNVIKDFRAFRQHTGRDKEPYCMGVEVHRTGRKILHFHAVFGGVWTDAERASFEAEYLTFRGFCRAKPLTDRAGAIDYAIKHLLKQDADGSFDFHFPRGSIFDSRAQRRHLRDG